MVELQSCAGMVNASALCAIEQEVNGDGVMNVIAEISSELQREREKNAELMEKISILEAQLLERDKVSIVTDGNGCCHNAKERRFKKFKRQKSEPSSNRIGDGTISKSIEMVPQMKHDIGTQDKPLEVENQKDRLVNWVSMDETQFLLSEELKDGDSGGDCIDTQDSDDEDDDDDFYEEDGIDIGHRDVENDENSRAGNGFKDHYLRDEGISQNMHRPILESSSGGHSVPTFLNMTQETDGDEKKDLVLSNSIIPINNKRKLKKLVRKEIKRKGECKGQLKMVDSGQEMYHKGHGSLSLQKKPPKVAFCPKEVKRMIDLQALLLKNAQSHTIRKIVVFASLGIRHGCEDLYELDFNHFSILRKGDPYVSPTDPGEHVLYENPGVRRKVFYPNRENPTLCPVQILEEEKAMRPSETSCPSCLFLCIKYGGRTRNLPQNEYVRQRMGRNKLKSFGPVMCRMAMLVHIRSGSFFFKALGITLLFMAGFPDNLVQKETKYRNLDLLQKYYRTDEDVEGEELFLPQSMTCDTQPSPSLQKLTGKASSKKLKGKKRTISASAPQNLPTSLVTQSAPPNSAPPTQFGLMGYTSNHTNLMAAFQSMPSLTSQDIPLMSNPAINTSSHNISYHNQTQYPMLQPQPTNAFMTMMYWPPPNAYPPCPYPSSYDYRPFPSIGNYMPIHSQPYFNHPSCSSFVPKIVEGGGKNDTALEEADSDSDSSSSSTEPKEVVASFQQ